MLPALLHHVEYPTELGLFKRLPAEIRLPHFGSEKMEALSSDQVPWISRLHSALRTGVACMLVLLGVSLCHDYVEFPVFGYVVSVTVLSESALGKALEDAGFALFGICQAVAGSMAVLQIIGPGNVSLGVCLTCIFIKSFIFCYLPNQRAMTKRLALAITTIIYVDAYIYPAIHPVFFPLKLAVTTLLAVTSAIIALVLPVPRLATYQARYLTKFCAKAALEDFAILVDAFSNNDPKELLAMRLKSKLLELEAVRASSQLKKKQDEASWEPQFLMPGASAVSRHFCERMSNMISCLRGMNMALEQGPAVDASDIIQGMVQNSLKQLRDWSSLFLAGIVQDFSNHQKQEPAVEQGREALFSVEGSVDAWNLSTSCRLCDEVLLLRRMFFLFSARKFVEEEIQLLTEQTLGSIPPKPSEHQDCALSSNLRLENADTVPVQPGKSRGSKFAFFTNAVNLAMDRKLIIESFKMGLTLTIAVYLGILYRKEYGYWSTITVALNLFNQQYGTFSNTSLRFQGTAVGTIYGYLVALITSQVALPTILALLPWLLLTSILRTSKLLKLVGASTTFTSAIIIVGRKRPGEVQDFAVIRITLAMVGLGIYLAVESLIFPRRAANLAREELAHNIKKIQDCFETLLDLQGTGCHACFRTGISQVSLKEQKVRDGISRLKALTSEAKVEPEFWYAPFHDGIYVKLAESQARLTELLNIILQASVDIHLAKDLSQEKVMLSGVCQQMKTDLMMEFDMLHRALRPTEASHCKIADSENQLRQPASVPVSYVDLSYSANRIITGFEELRSGQTGHEIILPMGTIAFCCYEVLRETMNLENMIQELLLRENHSN